MTELDEYIDSMRIMLYDNKGNLNKENYKYIMYRMYRTGDINIIKCIISENIKINIDKGMIERLCTDERINIIKYLFSHYEIIDIWTYCFEVSLLKNKKDIYIYAYSLIKNQLDPLRIYQTFVLCCLHNNVKSAKYLLSINYKPGIKTLSEIHHIINHNVKKYSSMIKFIEELLNGNKVTEIDKSMINTYYLLEYVSFSEYNLC